MQVPERILQAVRQIDVRCGGQLPEKVTASIGIAVYPQHGVQLEDLSRCSAIQREAEKAEPGCGQRDGSGMKFA